jgi:hypothetical protein
MITAIPFKNSIQLDMGKELRRHIQNCYSSNVAQEQSASCDYVNGLRAKVIAGLSKGESLICMFC